MFQRVHVYISFPCGHCQGVGMRKKGCSNIPTHTSTKCSKTAQKQWTAFSGSSPSPQLWESLTLGSSNVATFFERNHCQCRTKNSFPWTSEEPLGQLLLLPFLSSETPRGGERAGQRLGGQRQERERGLGAVAGGGDTACVYSAQCREKTLQCLLLERSLAPTSNSIILQPHKLGWAVQPLRPIISSFAKWLLLWRCPESWQVQGQPGTEKNTPPRLLLLLLQLFLTWHYSWRCKICPLHICLFVCLAFQILGLICKVKQRDREVAHAVNFHNLRVFSYDLIMESDVWGPSGMTREQRRGKKRLYTSKPNNHPFLNNHQQPTGSSKSPEGFRDGRGIPWI